MHHHARLAATLVTLGHLAAQSSPPTRVQVRPGDRFAFRVARTHTTAGDKPTTRTLEFEFTLTCGATQPSGALAASIAWTRIRGTEGGSILGPLTFDTDVKPDATKSAAKANEGADGLAGRLTAGLAAFCARAQDVEFDASGTVVALRDLEPALDKLVAQAGVVDRALLRGILSPSELTRTVSVLRTVPADATKAGAKWERDDRLATGAGATAPAKAEFELIGAGAEHWRVRSALRLAPAATTPPAGDAAAQAARRSGQAKVVAASAEGEWRATGDGVVVSSRTTTRARQQMAVPLGGRAIEVGVETVETVERVALPAAKPADPHK